MLAGMHPFAQLATLPRQLQHPQVRDLAWVLLSPPLLQHADGLQPRHPLSASAWAAQPERLASWLQQLDRQPAALQAQAPLGAGKRLGRYYEELWQFALARAPGIRLLASNLAIRAHGRTLGELDLLLEDGAGLQHVELAVKFYLGPTQADGTAQADWRGPNPQDRLDLKLDHLRRQQLPLAHSPAARALLHGYSRQPVHSAPWLGGYLFYPWPTACRPPAGGAAGHLRGRWLHRRDWPAWQERYPGPWLPLPRLGWLAPASTSDAELSRAGPLAHRLTEDGPPRLLAQLQQADDGRWQEVQRIFLVDDRWPSLAP